MNLFTRKMHLFCVSNMMVSFICTGLLSINGYANVIGSTDEAHEISLTTSDTEPVSQNGEGEENKYAFIQNSLEAVIGHQGETTTQEEGKDEYAFVTNGIEAVIGRQTVKKVEKVETNTKNKKKSTTTKKKTTTSVVEKKEVAATYSYSKPSYSSVTGDAIVSFARQFIGLKYVHAGRSLSTGTDCSGFTMLIYREFGVNLPPTVGGQINKGKYVAKKDLQKGDLVFYKAKGASGGASHVGIYIGGGSVIHESRPGVGVKISTVNMMKYVTARRVINSTAVKIAEQKAAEQTKVADTSSTTNTTTTNNTNNETTPTTTPTPNEEVTTVVDNSTNNNTAVSDNTNTSTTVETTPNNDTSETPTPTSTPTPQETPKPVETPTPEEPSTPPETNTESNTEGGSN